MPTPTTLRVEMLHVRRTANDKFFLTLGEGTAGMSPYNPIQLGLGVRFRLLTNNHVNDVRFTLRHIASNTERRVRPVKVGSNRWEIEGAIGGDNLGFPQPPLNYYVPQCFELDVLIRNRLRTDLRTYTFWVGEGPVGTIYECVDRKVIGAKPLVCCFDGLGFRGYGFPDEFTEFFLNNNSPVMDCLNDDGEGLLPDPLQGVYVEGLPAPLAGFVGGPFPFTRAPAPAIPVYDPPESDMIRLRNSYGDQWKYRRPLTDNENQQGRNIEKFSRDAVGAPVLPAVAGVLPANPYLGEGQTPVGAVYPGPNSGVSARGPSADYRLRITLGETQSVAAPGLIIISLECRGFFPDAVYLFAGLAGDWVGGGNPGGPLHRDNGVGALSKYLTSVVLAGHYGVVSGGAWAAGAPGTQYIVGSNPPQVSDGLDLSLAGLAPVAGQVWAIQAVIFDSAAPTGVSAGILGVNFDRVATVISNAARFVWVP